MSNFKTIDSCEVCKNKNLISLLDLGLLPLCDDLIPINENRDCQEYPTEVLFCEVCKTAHQKYQVKKEILFNDEYHYRARFTQDVIDGMSELVCSTKDYIGNLIGKKVLDIGCNDGSLLDFFRQEKCSTYGIEPTDAFLDAKEKKHKIFKEYLTPDFSKKFIKENGKMDLITFTNVFAHIDNLDELLNSVKILMHDDSCLIIENHYLGSILEGFQFDTFYHEHPRTYSFSSFKEIAKSLGMNINKLEFPSRYGGNIRVFISKSNSKIYYKNNLEDLIQKENNFPNLFNQMEEKINLWKLKKKSQIDCYLKNYPKIVAKAFPGRAAILMKLLNLDKDKIHAVFEKPGSKKIGHFVPGTKIPILSDQKLFNMADENFPIMNLAWHIPNEIRNYLKENNLKGDVFEIIDPDEW